MTSDLLTDRAEIQELTARYALHLDTRQVDAMMGLWADDAVFDETAVGLGLLEGPAAIRRFFEEAQAFGRAREPKEAEEKTT